MSRPKTERPSWLNFDCYSFVSTMPLEGWVWEFMRRANLKTVLQGGPVDAMNPNPELDFSKDDMIDLWYTPWNQAIKKNAHWKKDIIPYYHVPAIRFPNNWPPGFKGHPIQISTPFGKWVKVEIVIDLNRRDTVIKNDFPSILKEIRNQNKIPQPKIPKLHIDNWKEPLMVWDLYQYNIPAKDIIKFIRKEPSKAADEQWIYSQVNNYYDQAFRYIEDGKWRELARFIGAKKIFKSKK